MNFIDACQELISIDTTPTQGSGEATQFLAQLALEKGFFVSEQNESYQGLSQSNILIRPQKEIPEEEVLYLTHIDTAEAGALTHWTKTQSNPFRASIYGDEFFGLGSADTKLDFLCKLYGAESFLGKNLKHPFVLVGTYGAETGMDGATKLVRRKLVHAKKAFVGEPTSMKMVHAGPGYVVVEISIPFSEEEKEYRSQHDLMETSTTQSQLFSGKAAHAGQPEMGENAIQKMLDYLIQLPEGIAVMGLEGGINYSSVPDFAVLEIDLVAGFKDPIVPKISHILKQTKKMEKEFLTQSGRDGLEKPALNIGVIRTFDDQVQVLGTCRMPYSVGGEVYEKWLKGLESACKEKAAQFRVRDIKKPFHVSKDSRFLQDSGLLLEELGIDSEPIGVALTTEASVLNRAGIECVVIGPGVGAGNSHAPNEKVSMKELNQAKLFYKKSIERFCL